MEVEVYTVFPNGDYSLVKVPKENIVDVFKNLKKKPSMVIDGTPYKVSHYTGIGTNILNNNDCMTVYLEDTEGKSCEFMFFPTGEEEE
jgi:hypothetical protein